MITDEDVYSVNDQLIISKGQKLTDNYINRLVFYSIASVRIRDGSEDIVPEQKPHEDTYSEKILASQEYKEFKASFEVAVLHDPDRFPGPLGRFHVREVHCVRNLERYERGGRTCFLAV